MSENGMTQGQLVDLIKGVVKDHGMEALGDQIVESMQKELADADKRTKAEQAKHELDLQRKALFGDAAKKGADKGVGLGAAEFVACFMGGGKSKDGALAFARKNGASDAVVKALEAGDFSAGGALIPETMSADIIGYLHNNSVVRNQGANTVDLSGGPVNFGKVNAIPTAHWIEEGGAITASKPGTSQVRLTAKKLGVFVPMSNDLLRRLPGGSLNIFRQDMLSVARNAEDAAFIRGSGTEAKPKGILNWTKAANKFNANSTVTLANVTTDLIKAMFLVENSNIPMNRLGWLLSPRTKYYLMTLRTDDGYPVFMSEIADGSLYGHSLGVTNNIPTNLDATGDGDNDETEIYFGDFSQSLIGDALSVRIEESNAATFVDENGDTINGFQSDQTVVRLILEVDYAQRHDSAFAVIEGVDYGKNLG